MKVVRMDEIEVGVERKGERREDHKARERVIRLAGIWLRLTFRT